MNRLENNSRIDSFNINGSEKEAKFDTAKEILYGDEYYKIKELESGDNLHRVFQFSINDNSDKELTVDEVKEIFSEKYWYHKDAISLRKDTLPFDYGICQAGDLVHVYIEIWEDQTIEASWEISAENEEFIETLENIEREESVQKESPYKEMIQNQTKPITRWLKDNLDEEWRQKISLTFDDWYWKDNIEFVLDKLAWSDITATFFVLWDCLKNTPSLWKKAKEAWHQICCHTYSHIYLSNNSDITDLTSWWNEVDLDTRSENVKKLLWDKYYRNLQTKSWQGFPRKIQSDLLLETEILMREEQVKATLGEDYLNDLKLNFPFFRFPGWNWATRPKNIAVLKKLWYLSIWWSKDFYVWSWSSRKHMSLEYIKNMKIEGWEILLFHFKKYYKKWEPTEWQYLSAYIDNIIKSNKVSKPLSETVK